MNIQYFKHYSKSLGRDMEYKTYGTEGKTVLVFPSQDGRFYDFENFDMVSPLSRLIDAGRIQLVCADSIDGETWSASNADEHQRATMHERWFNYIVGELVPRVARRGEQLMTVGCSMGGYHAMNFFLRRPDLFDTVLSLSGLYHADFFFPGYHDPIVYDNSPLDYLPNMPMSHPFLKLYRQHRIILCVGQGAWEDDLLASTRRMEAVLREKQVPAWVDYWGHDVSHDWSWWRKQLPYFMDKLFPME